MRRDTEERRAGGRGTEERGQREHTLFFLPSSERVAIDTVHLIKICAYPPQNPQPLSLAPPPLLSLSLERWAPSSCLSARPIQAQVQSAAGQKKHADREEVVWAGRGAGEALDICHHYFHMLLCPPPPSHSTHTQVMGRKRSCRPKMQTLPCFGITF